jgi:hypothetical protein
VDKRNIPSENVSEEGMVFLGTPVGTDAFITAFLDEKAKEAINLLDSMRNRPDGAH